ncbi:MAG: SDR family oxidoreductase, partial [Planctomycetota bacterium]
MTKRILVTGSHGFIGAVLVPMLQQLGHEVSGLDVDYYRDAGIGESLPSIPMVDVDLRDVGTSDLQGFDAVMHLAALSNDPLGNLDSQLTYDINHLASVKLAKAAKSAGVKRFLFSSSCSMYGAAGDELLTESAAFNPITPYGESKVLADREISELADQNFSPSFLRNATAYGFSPRLRMDLVVNDFVA